MGLSLAGKPHKKIIAYPFYAINKSCYAAADLRAGDILVLVNGEYVVLELVQHEILEAPITVYNLEVQDYHTYYVGYDGVLVHNSCHGNSLRSEKKNELYVLRDKNTNVVKKIGETTQGIHRYTKKYYNTNNVYMQVIQSGSKRTIHYQQHRLLVKYFNSAGELPKLNKSLW